MRTRLWQGHTAGRESKITQPFYMVDKSRSRKAGGTGLGLAIADEIARLHGARLEFESEIGRGTKAKVVFERYED
jgi:signal transduction histidine kinase